MTSFFRSGSFGHHTSVRNWSDIDYFAVIPTDKLKVNSNYTLQGVREALLTRFPRTGIAVRSPAVVVPFGTSISERHEILPADLVGTVAGSNVYDIPDREGGWMPASPRAHNGWVNEVNNQVDQDLKPLIRLIKAWNFFRSVRIRSFYLEMRTTQYGSGERAIIYKLDFIRVLRYLKTVELAAMQDPMGISGYVHPCSGALKESAISKLDTAISRSEKALQAENKENIALAFQWWDQVFNGHFPSFNR